MKPGDQQCFVVDKPNICDDRGCPHWHDFDNNSWDQSDWFRKSNDVNTSWNNYGCNNQCSFGFHDTCDEKAEIINEAIAKGYVTWCYWKYKLIVQDKDTACVVCKH